MQVEGTVALVTGANRGMGAAITSALVAAGARRVYAGMRHPRVQAGTSPRVVPIELDITNSEQVARAARVCRDVEILVNNAGIALLQPLIGAVDTVAGEEEMRVNYFGTLAMCRAFAPVLARNGGGAIVNVVSIVARVPAPYAGSYSASKAAELSMTQAIRGELASQRTLVIGVMPGAVDTDMTRGFDFDKLAPEVVGEAVVQALRDGTEDVYPGPAAAIALELLRDPKAVEKQFATTTNPAPTAA